MSQQGKSMSENQVKREGLQPGETQVTDRDAAHWVFHRGNMYRDGYLWKGIDSPLYPLQISSFFFD